MKIKVLKEFKDLAENKLRKVGDEFEVTKKRFEEIDTKLREKYKDVAWVEEVKEAPKSPKATKKTKGSK